MLESNKELELLSRAHSGAICSGEHAPLKTAARPAVENPLSLQSIPSRINYIAFQSAEIQDMLDEIRKKAGDKKHQRYGFDLQVHQTDAADQRPGRPQIIRISSRQWGYDFVLLKIPAHGLFGFFRPYVQIFRSHLNADDYRALRTASNLGKAITMIDKMFCKDAQAHLA